jgi:hypothetical protein
MTDCVVFYSLTGKSRETAERLAKAMSADLVEIVEEQPRKPGFLGYMGATLDSLRKRKPKIKDTPSVGAGDRVILCGPIWLGRIAGPLRTWLDQHGKRVSQLVWVPHSGAGGEWTKATAELTELMGRAPSHVAPFAENDAAKGKAEGKVRELVSLLRKPA